MNYDSFDSLFFISILTFFCVLKEITSESGRENISAEPSRLLSPSKTLGLKDSRSISFSRICLQSENEWPNAR